MTIIGKRNKLRVIDLAPFEGYDFLPRLRLCRQAVSFWHDEGEPYASFAPTFAKLVKRVEAWAKANGVEFRRFKFHHLRHRHARRLAQIGRDIYTLQGRLGHTSVKTTEMYLDYLTPQEVQIAKFGAAAKRDKQSA